MSVDTANREVEAELKTLRDEMRIGDEEQKLERVGIPPRRPAAHGARKELPFLPRIFLLSAATIPRKINCLLYLTQHVRKNWMGCLEGT